MSELMYGVYMILLQWVRRWQGARAEAIKTARPPQANIPFLSRRVPLMGMVTASVVLLFVLTTTLASQAQTETPPAQQAAWQLPDNLAAARAVPFAPGELLVGFHGEAGMRSTEGLLATFAATAIERLDLRGLDGATGDAGVQGYRLAVPEGQEWAITEQLLQAPDVAFVSPNWLVYAATPAQEENKDEATEADDAAMTAIAQPEAPFLINDPKYEDAQWYLQRINASRAWSLAYAADGFAGALAEVQVAIVDSGIDVNHPEFRGRLLPGYNYLSPGSPPVAECGHGTHVAGLLGAVANNASGIAGVAPKVKIDARKVLNRNCSGTISDVADAIHDATDDGADIINLSIEVCASNDTLASAIQYARNKGVMLIAAAGNNRCDKANPGDLAAPVSYPAAYDGVMAIAATTYNNNRASYSNIGTKLALAAPGGESTSLALSMLSTWPGGVKCRDNAATLPQSDYCTSEGTSMAAAVVSGAAALIKSVRPDFTADQIDSLLRTTATPSTEGAALVGSGILDIHRAMRAILPSKLQLSTNSFINHLPFGAAPYTVHLRLDNPSLQSANWQATLSTGQTWAHINGTSSNAISSTVTYGKPSYLSLTITPTQLLTGNYAASVRVDQVKADNSLVSSFVDINLTIGSAQTKYFFIPIIVQGQPVPVTTPSFRWEVPASAADRTTHGMTDNSDIGIGLPFTFTLRHKSYLSAHISSEGFVSFPDTNLSSSLPNQCMPNLAQPAQAIYGWWADLNPGAAGARVSTFSVATDRFVIEFENVPIVGSTPANLISFQIVLYRNGNVALNYRDVPTGKGVMPVVTIGIEARDGLFYNQVACNDGTTQLGYAPSSRQTLTFDAQEDVY